MANNAPFVFGGAGQGQAAASFPQQGSPTNAHSQPHPPPPAQAAFQQNALLPGIDMSALAGISPDQVALIARLLQSGQLPLPPPPPGVPTPPAPVQAPVITPSSNTPVEPVNAQQEDVDMDKEDGEIDDAEPASKAQSTATIISIKNEIQSSRGVSERGRESRGVPHSRRASNAQKMRAGDRPVAKDHTNDYALLAKDKQSKDFVLAMHRAGYSYRQLAAQVENPKPLRRMFKALGLPVSSDHGLPNDSHPSTAPSTQARSPTALAGSMRQTAEALQKGTQPKAAAKPDRSAYLAKLQALKAAKASPTTNQPPQQAPAASLAISAVPSPTANGPTAAPVAAPSAAPTPTTKAVKTELARQRLEAFKAARAAKLAESNAASSTAPSIPTTAGQVASPGGLGAGLQAVSSKLEQQMPPTAFQHTGPPPDAPRPAFSPVVQPPVRSFSGLPGLFMNSDTQSASSWTPPQPLRTVSQPLVQGTASQPSNLPRKRLMTEAPSSGSTPTKRPFGQSRTGSEDESFIIENSDDEDEGAPMDMDVAPKTTDSSTMMSRPELARQASANGLHQTRTSTSSGTNTPSGVTYEEKRKAIDELNRKIAEREAKRKAQEKVAAPQDSIASPASALPGIFTQSSIAGDPTEGPIGNQTTSFAPERPVSAGAVKVKQQKEELRQRIAELEAARRPAAAPVQTTSVLVATDPATPMSASLTASDEVMSNTREASEPAAANVTATAPEIAAFEDDEVDDESDFDFYGDEDAVDAPQPQQSGEHVDSQATTVSGVLEANMVFPQNSLPPRSGSVGAGLSEEESVDRMEKDTEIQSDGKLADVNADAGGLSQSEPPAPDEELSDLARTRETSAGIDVDMHAEDSEKESSEEGSGLNGPSAVAEPEQLNVEDNVDDLDGSGQSTSGEAATFDARRSINADDLEEDDIDSSDASSSRSSDSEEYEPAPADEPQPETAPATEPMPMPMPAEEPATTEMLAYAPAETPVDDSVAPQPGYEVDDLAPELQPAAEQLDQQPSLDAPKSYYTPYESIMKIFKDYRYHPDYLKSATNGFHSPTWNHQIDPDKPLCPTEGLGDTCRDNRCVFQHFDKMAINDNQLLQSMGTKNIPADTPADTARWSAGLQVLIRALKAEGVRDASTIAARIAQYRREFCRDPTRVITIR